MTKLGRREECLRNVRKKGISAYILEQCPAPAWMGDPPPGYQKIFDRATFRLYRRADLVNNAGD